MSIVESGVTGPRTPQERDDRLPVTPDTIVVYSDLNCSFAHVAVHRLHETRRRLGLDGTLWFDHRAFPLELFNRRVNERPGVDSEVSVVGALEPEAGWRLWQGPDWTFPVTMLPALEAVQAAKAQGWHASEQLDRALRRAFWAEDRCISMRHVILDVATETDAVDVDALAAELDTGRFRARVHEHFAQARDGRVNCSPHVFLHDGTAMANPGVERHWINGRFGVGFPVIDSDDPSVYELLLRRAADAVRAGDRL
jgi:predicted DsbA family dithiol-disulfide isomerase